MKGTTRKFVELLLMESVIVSKTIGDKFPIKFRSIRNQIKQQSQVVTKLESRRKMCGLILRIRIGFNAKEQR